MLGAGRPAPCPRRQATGVGRGPVSAGRKPGPLTSLCLPLFIIACAGALPDHRGAGRHFPCPHPTMKLATYKDGSRDGQLLVVSRDLALAHYATGIADRLQQVLDDWSFLAPQLQDLYAALNAGRTSQSFAFEPGRCMAPLPRACQWVAGAAYPGPLQPGMQAPASAPVLRQGASDDFLGPCDDVVAASESMGIDFEAGLAAITGDVHRGASAQQALQGVRLLMLVNDVALRQLAAEGPTGGAQPPQSRPATSCSPVAVTPDELGDAWQGGRVHLTLQCSWNGRRVGLCEAGPEMAFHFGQLIAHLASTRNVRAGSIVGSGPVGNRDRSRGYCSIAHKRAFESIDGAGPASTAYLRFGDTLRIEMKDRAGHSLFGAIDQALAAPA